ncbi:hypothetical protein [Clostridium tertium]|uniref:Uncharacterized protein n=1 Tax=Clostridium tertium TaxID=1559 RepID=A0A6N2ZLZ9_9CLOT
MANMLIKIGTAIILFMNLFTQVARADSGNLKQCFYIVTEDKNSKDLYEDLNLINSKDIPVLVVIDPDDNINKKNIDVLKTLQDEINLDVILENDKNLEKSYFVIKGYDKELRLSGLCEIQNDKLLYMGESDTSFDFIDIDKDPVKAVSEVNIHKGKDVNYALVVNGDDFNISTLLLANSELEGLPLDISNYSFIIEDPTLMDNIIIYIGYINIVFFSISVIIYLVAIIIFKKWSIKKFLD